MAHAQLAAILCSIRDMKVVHIAQTFWIKLTTFGIYGLSLSCGKWAGPSGPYYVVVRIWPIFSTKTQIAELAVLNTRAPCS